MPPKKPVKILLIAGNKYFCVFMNKAVRYIKVAIAKKHVKILPGMDSGLFGGPYLLATLLPGRMDKSSITKVPKKGSIAISPHAGLQPRSRERRINSEIESRPEKIRTVALAASKTMS